MPCVRISHSPSCQHCVSGSKYISKSEDNLLTPKCGPTALRTSWCNETPAGAREFNSFADTPMSMCLKSSHASEPAIAQCRTPVAAKLPAKLCCASSVDSLENSVLQVHTEPEPEPEPGPTLLKIKEVLGEDEKPTAAETSSLPADAGTPGVPFQCSRLAAEQNITFGQIEIAALSPLHIDSVIFETGAFRSPPTGAAHTSLCQESDGGGEEEEERVDRSRLIDALDIQSPTVFIQGVSSGPQSTPYKPAVAPVPLQELVTPPRVGEEGATHAEVQDRQPRVADHIQHFNRLTLRSPRGPVAAAAAAASHIRSPLKFERTPVRQTIRRINSMLGDSRRQATQSAGPARGRVQKATSLESGLSPRPAADCQGAKKRPPPPVPPKKVRALDRRAKACALDDVTNKVQPKSKAGEAVPDTAVTPRPLAEQRLQKDKSHYRGSPRNPLHQGRLLSATKPVDL